MAIKTPPAIRPVVAPAGSHLLVDGKPWFYLADTVWSAFTHADLDDWRSYVRLRRRQGFNSLQISVLPILHDMSRVDSLPEPFRNFWSGQPAFGALADSYVTHAKERLEVACEAGLVPAIVDVWCNYAPGTWASRRDPRYVMDELALEGYLASVSEHLSPLAPIRIVAGDTDLESSETVAFYQQALAIVKEQTPDALTAIHLQPGAQLPATLAGSDLLDLYVFQSGHQIESQDSAYTLAEAYRTMSPVKPVINAEPCYEGHGFGFAFGRFGAFEVRRAAWQSVLAGASAGLAYGAHGVWQWHGQGAEFTNPSYSDEPFDRTTAVNFPGARDVSFLKSVVDAIGLHDLEPAQDLLVDPRPGVRLAARADGRVIVAYAPYATAIHLRVDDVRRVEQVDLATRHIDIVTPTYEKDVARLPMAAWPGDALMILHLGGDT